MKKKIILGFLFFVPFFLNSCSPENKPSSTVNQKNETNTFSEANKNITVTEGSEFVIQLASNIPAGFKWDMSNNFDPEIIKITSTGFKDMDNQNSEKGSFEKWKFKALKKGNTEIKIKYFRAWEKNSTPDKEITFKILVN